MKWFFDYLI